MKSRRVNDRGGVITPSRKDYSEHSVAEEPLKATARRRRPNREDDQTEEPIAEESNELGTAESDNGGDEGGGAD